MSQHELPTRVNITQVEKTITQPSYDISSQRIQASKDFAEALELLDSESFAYRQRIAELMREHADSILGKQPTGLLTMTTSQAKAFELEQIKFGQHQDTEYRYVPIDYLRWVGDQSVRLQAYLRSDVAEKRTDNSSR